MSDTATTSPAQDVPPPPTPAIEPKSWEWGIAPHHIGLFLSILFFDRLAPATLPVGGLLPTLAGAALGGVTALLLFWYPTAWWGHCAREPFGRLAAAVYGERTAARFPGLVMAFAHILLFGAAITYGVDLTFRALVVCRLLDPAWLQPTHLGGLTLRSPLFLFTALVWCWLAALIAMKFTRWIAALMIVYPIFPALLLGGVAAWGLAGMGNAPVPYRTASVPGGAWIAFLAALQFVVAYFALPSLNSTDWGMWSRAPRDVRMGGLVGVAMPPAIIVALACLAVIGAQARLAAAASPPSNDLTFSGVLQTSIGGNGGAAMLMAFGLGALAPAVYSSDTFGRLLKTVWPNRKRIWLSLAGATLAFVLPAMGWGLELLSVFTVCGALVAPIAGATVAEAIRLRGTPAVADSKGNAINLGAWAVGAVIGLLPVIGQAASIPALARFQPAVLPAFAVGFVVRMLTARKHVPAEPASVA